MTLTYLLFSVAHLLTSPLLLRLSPYVFLGGASGSGFCSPADSTNCSSFSGLSPNERPPFFNFQKARWDDLAYYFDSHCPSAEKYSSLSLSSAASFFTSLTLNAAKSFIPFDRIKSHPKAWWSAEVEEAVSERRKAFAAAHRSNEDWKGYISASRFVSSVIAKAEAEA